jgi:hypothetical protein
MQTENYPSFPIAPNSYAAFDAISLRNLIIERLNAQGTFTDQNYIGSNLSSIIDIVSYAFNTLLFYLNRTSSEATFTEAQLYENINRIVKLLDYKPVGYQTSTLSFQASADNTRNVFDTSNQYYTIPRYSYVVVGGTAFSFNEDITFTVNEYNSLVNLPQLSNRKLLFQGSFREAPLFIAAGNPNETTTLNIVNARIDHFNIHVYVYETAKGKWVQYKESHSLYMEQPSAKVFEKRLNANLQYDITFGNDVNGRKLQKGEKVAIYFLQSSGEKGVIGPGSLKVDKVGSTYSVLNTALLSQIMQDVKQDETSVYLTTRDFNNIILTNTAGSTPPKDIETPDEIRLHAPSLFRSQYRLVTQKDFEVFIQTNFSNFISDVKVFNNWDYTSEYLRYFQELNLDPIIFQQIALNQVGFSDACNFNNIYICAMPAIGIETSLKYLLPAQKEAILSEVQTLKPLTTETTFLDPIYMCIKLGMEDSFGEINLENRYLTRLEITKNKKTGKSEQSIINEVASVFQRFFLPQDRKIGDVFEYSKLVAEILSIEGVDDISTVNLDTNQTVSGLRLLMWNPTYPDLDQRTVNHNINLKPFQFLFYEDLIRITEAIYIKQSAYYNAA